MLPHYSVGSFGQKEAAIKAFDDKLARLGYDPDHAKRSHHRTNDVKPE